MAASARSSSRPQNGETPLAGHDQRDAVSAAAPTATVTDGRSSRRSDSHAVASPSSCVAASSRRVQRQPGDQQAASGRVRPPAGEPTCAV